MTSARGPDGNQEPPAFRRIALAILRPFGLAFVFLVLLSEDLARLAISPFLALAQRLALWRRTEELIARMPPYGALAILAVPVIVLEPFQWIGLYWMASGAFVAGFVLHFAAKLLAMAVIVRLHDVALPKLLAIGWYARLYHAVLDLRARLYGAVLAVPGVARALAASRAVLDASRVAVRELVRRYWPARSGK